MVPGNANRKCNVYFILFLTALAFGMGVILCNIDVRRTATVIGTMATYYNTTSENNSEMKTVTEPVYNCPHFSNQPTSVLDSLKSLGYTVKHLSNVTDSWNITSSRQYINGSRLVVPNIVHYVWLGTDLKFTYIHYLSFLSVHRFIKPDAILVHGEVGPNGTWWDRVKSEVSNIYLVVIKTPSVAPSGKPFQHKAHASDVIRTEVLYDFGGIYLDSDVWVLKSFDDLRRYSTVMGQEHGTGLCNGIMVSEPGAPFLKLLLQQYDTYGNGTEGWAIKSVHKPHIFALENPNWIHVEQESLNRPNWMEMDKIYLKVYNWKNNYAMHLWVRLARDKKFVPKTLKEIAWENTTFGQMAGHICHERCYQATS